uniref:VPS37 C-terminal domain-containing protein n=1 Tax=Macrostomum lignano TaxID=282301 RepID=A0A1I8JRI0_9PLAT
TPTQGVPRRARSSEDSARPHSLLRLAGLVPAGSADRYRGRRTAVLAEGEMQLWLWIGLRLSWGLRLRPALVAGDAGGHLLRRGLRPQQRRAAAPGSAAAELLELPRRARLVALGLQSLQHSMVDAAALAPQLPSWACLLARCLAQRHSIDGDLRRKTDEFLASNPSLSKKLDELDRLMMRQFSADTAAAREERLEGEAEADSAETAQLREQLSEALEKASAASELAWHYENFIRELKSINAKLEARLTQLAQERRHCARLLAAGATGDEGLSGRGVDLYKAIRELQKPVRAAHPSHFKHYCSACGSAMSSSVPMSDGGDANGKIIPNAQQQQQQPPHSTQRDQIVAGAILGWKRGVRVLAGAKPSDIAVVPLRPRHQQPTQQPTQQPDPTDDATQTEQPQSDPLADSLTENARLRRDLHALAKALRTAEEDAKERRPSSWPLMKNRAGSGGAAQQPGRLADVLF